MARRAVRIKAPVAFSQHGLGDFHRTLSDVQFPVHAGVERIVLVHMAASDRSFRRTAALTLVGKQVRGPLRLELLLELHIGPHLERRIALDTGTACQTEHGRDGNQRVMFGGHPSTTSTSLAPTLRMSWAVFCASNFGSSASTTSRNRSSEARCALR